MKMRLFPVPNQVFRLRSFLFLLALMPMLLSAQSAIPNFSFLTLDGEPFTQAQIDLDKPALIIRFDPYCEHCEQQAEWIAEAQEAFQHVQLIYVAFEEVGPISEFRDRYFGEGEWPNLHFLRDENYQFEEFFGYTEEYLNVYAYKPGAKRLKYFGEEQPAEVLLKYL
ncbi:MAG: hypothetical protein D6722_26125 [Bacteroidetes bacterium]|nr:MAG: hypothetical protein D6722_26125 [Bacteroidota bacterium]